MDLSSLINMLCRFTTALSVVIALSGSSVALAVNHQGVGYATAPASELEFLDGFARPVSLENVALALPHASVMNTKAAFRAAMAELEGQDLDLFKSLLETDSVSLPPN